MWNFEKYAEWPSIPTIRDIPDTRGTPYNVIDFTKELDKHKKGLDNLITAYNDPNRIQAALIGLSKIEEKYKKEY